MGLQQGVVPHVLGGPVAQTGSRPGSAAKRLREAAIAFEGAVERLPGQAIVRRRGRKTEDDTRVIMVPGGAILLRQSQCLRTGRSDERLGKANGKPGRGIFDKGKRIAAWMLDITAGRECSVCGCNDPVAHLQHAIPGQEAAADEVAGAK